MPRRKSSQGDPCPVARSLDIIGDRWSLLIVRDAFDGLHRFSEFHKSLQVARNILSDRLRRLVEGGILDTQDASDGSAYQEYVLTAKGETLFPVVVALRQWGERHLFARGERHSRLIDKATARKVPAMLPRDADGRVLSPEAVFVRKVE